MDNMINYVLNCLTRCNENYAFYKNHPIDIRRRKFKIWRKMFSEGTLQCHACKATVTEIRLIKCTSDGSIHKPTGKTKHTFKLFGDRGQEMTIDHWIPKSFLRKRKLHWNMMDNLMLMCEDCNKFKSDIIPHNWQELYDKMMEKHCLVLPKYVPSFVSLRGGVGNHRKML